MKTPRVHPPGIIATVCEISIVLLAIVSLLSGCSRASESVPEVLGVPFAVPVSAISQHLRQGAKPELYPFISLYGYKLQLPNPDNWTVIVQEEDPDLLENRIWTIYISRGLDAPCALAHTQDFVGIVRKKYGPMFSESYTQRLPNEEGYRFFAASKRRTLTVTIQCSAISLLSKFIYIDLDRYKYRKPDEIQEVISTSMREAKEYEARAIREAKEYESRSFK